MSDTKNYPDSKKMEDLLNALGKTANLLANDLEYSSHATIYHVINGINNMSDGMRQRIVKKFPNVNMEFLKSGQLPILLTGSAIEEQANIMGIKIERDVDFLMFKKFISVPANLQEINAKLDKILKHLDLE